VTRLTILGGGHVGQTLVALLGGRFDISTTIWSRRWRHARLIHRRAIGREGTYGIGQARIQPSLRQAVDRADIIVIAVPGHGRAALLKRIAGRIDTCALLVAWEGLGAFPETLRHLGMAGPTIVGLQRSPLCCRALSGDTVEILGVRTRVVAATVDSGDSSRAARLMKAIFPFKFAFAPDYRCVSLSPGNPMIHPARLYSCGHAGADPIRPGVRFYQDWNDSASRVLIDLHREVADVRDRLRLPRAFVRTLVDESDPAPQAVTRDIRAARSLDGILLPVRSFRRRWQLDRRHRFFREDIAESLAYIRRIARSGGVTMPVADAISAWSTADQPQRT